jgi:hypothetical protein
MLHPRRWLDHACRLYPVLPVSLQSCCRWKSPLSCNTSSCISTRPCHKQHAQGHELRGPSRTFFGGRRTLSIHLLLAARLADRRSHGARERRSLGHRCVDGTQRRHADSSDGVTHGRETRSFPRTRTTTWLDLTGRFCGTRVQRKPSCGATGTASAGGTRISTAVTR